MSRAMSTELGKAEGGCFQKRGLMRVEGGTTSTCYLLEPSLSEHSGGPSLICPSGLYISANQTPWCLPGLPGRRTGRQKYLFQEVRGI